MNIGQNIDSMEMNVNKLANFIFIENIKNIKITISSNEFENSKDTFFFMLDLYFKGMVLLYGKRNEIDNSMTVILNELNYEQIESIKDKLKLAHIKLNFMYYHYTTIEEGNELVLERYQKGNIQEINKLPDNLNITNYIFKICLDENIYNISFELLIDI